MTTINQTTLLIAAVTALASTVAELKKAGVETLGLGTEIIDGVKYRDLKNWLRDFKAKQKAATPPAPKAEPKAAAANSAVEFTTKELKGADLLIGRVKDAIKTVVKSPEGVRVAVTESGLRVPVSMIERNNRGNLRTVAEFSAKRETKPAATAPTTAAHTNDVRDLELTNSSNIASAVYDRARKVLRVEFKTGAVYEYANVGIREASNFEKAESAGKFFAEFIKGKKDTTKIKAGAPRAPKAPVEVKAEPKATVKAAPKTEAAPEYKTTELRGATLLIGRKAETIVKVVASKDGEGRDVITDTKARFPVSCLRRNNRGKFVVEAQADKPAAQTKAPAQTVKEPKGNRRAKFDAETANNVRKSQPVPALPKASEVSGSEVRVIKGTKDKMVKVVRVVTRDGTRVAVTENRVALPFGQIIYNDGVLTYTGKLTAEQFRAA